MTGAGEIADGGLPMTARQEQFSLAYVQLITAAAGCSIKSHETDYDGVDITITSSSRYKTHWGAEFELQLKCTTQQGLLHDDYMAWVMKRDPFLKLTRPKRYIGAFLGVLLVPPEHHQLLNVSQERLITDSRMYFEHAGRLGQISEGNATKTVRLPRSNLFDVRSLRGIMQKIGDGGTW